VNKAWTLSNLNAVPQFADTIADRGWHAWKSNGDSSIMDYRAGLEPMLTSANSIPFAVVAHDAETYLGSVLVIEHDLDARPNLSPWIAALWVEPVFRSKGVAQQLVERAVAQAKDLGVKQVYLCALPHMAPYYLARGWWLDEKNVEGLNVFCSSMGSLSNEMESQS
jgi:GNAT superfamily N-acetyltransferase